MKRKAENDEKYLQNEASDMHSDKKIDTDPQGSWTGVPDDDDDVPVQDADDL